MHLLSIFQVYSVQSSTESFGKTDTKFNYMLIHGFQTGLQAGNLLRFAINEGGLCFTDGKLERADLHYLGKPNRARAFADSYSKVSRQF